jgi:probable HAF family extracellular repeat protein
MGPKHLCRLAARPCRKRSETHAQVIALCPIRNICHNGNVRERSVRTGDENIPGVGTSASINNRSQIAATFLGSDGMQRVVLWDRGQQISLTNLEVVGSIGINDRTQIALSIAQPAISGFGTPYQAFLWMNGMLQALGYFPAAIPESIAQGINNRGQIVGNGTTLSGADAFLWQKGQMTNLGTLPGPYPGGSFSAAQSINDRGEIVGQSDSSSGYRHATLWEPDGTIIDLGLPPTFTTENTTAWGINARGQIVGNYRSGTGEPGSVVALLWDQGKIIDLGTARPDDIESLASGINDKGEIIGQSARPVADYTGWFWDGSNHNLDDLIDQNDPLKLILHITNALSVNNQTQIVVLAHDARTGPCVKFNCPARLYLLTPSKTN